MSKFAIQHEPKNFEQLVFACADVAKRLDQYAHRNRTKNIILHGDYGTGKSTIAKLLVKTRDPVNTVYWPVINCVESGIDFQKRLGGSWSFSKWLDVEPMCILEEADLLSRRSQFELRAFMDMYGGMFILTTNFLHGMDKSLQSRCDVLEIKPPSIAQCLPAARRILDACKVPLDDIALGKLLRGAENWRQALEALEDVVQEYRLRMTAS